MILAADIEVKLAPDPMNAVADIFPEEEILPGAVNCPSWPKVQSLGVEPSPDCSMISVLAYNTPTPDSSRYIPVASFSTLAVMFMTRPPGPPLLIIR